MECYGASPCIPMSRVLHCSKDLYSPYHTASYFNTGIYQAWGPEHLRVLASAGSANPLARMETQSATYVEN